MSKTTKIIIIILGAGIILAITFAFFPRPAPEVDIENIAESSVIDYPSEFSEDIKWRLRNKYTLPWGLEKQLKKNGIEIEVPNLHMISSAKRLEYLKEQLSLKRPIIILGEQDGYEHYITLFGFNSGQDAFYIYDSMYDKEREGYTKDSNGEMPGNKTITEKELLDFWQGGGMYGIYNWYSIVASTPTESRFEG